MGPVLWDAYWPRVNSAVRSRAVGLTCRCRRRCRRCRRYHHCRRCRRCPERPATPRAAALARRSQTPGRGRTLRTTAPPSNSPKVAWRVGSAWRPHHRRAEPCAAIRPHARWGHPMPRLSLCGEAPPTTLYRLPERRPNVYIFLPLGAREWPLSRACNAIGRTRGPPTHAVGQGRRRHAMPREPADSTVSVRPVRRREPLSVTPTSR
jgi:hypothetical protein